MDKREGTPVRSSRPVPTITLPKGGGAIRGIGEKFASNPVTGTGSFSVPIYTSPGRSGFGPQLALAYDSGSGNGPFGFGWSLSLPYITRKTDKGLPKYDDASESDVFILSGAEDLVPMLKRENGGNWVWVDEFRDKDGRLVFDENLARDGYSVRRYRPRIEGLFARIERWTKNNDGDVHWRSISKDNILTVYGRNESSRILDPGDPHRIFSWLICESYDDKGNAIVYQYAPEKEQGVDLSKANEGHRLRTANRYLKRIKYGNQKPLLLNPPSPSLRESHLKAPDFGSPEADSIWRWMFEVVFDYLAREKDNVEYGQHLRLLPHNNGGSEFVEASTAELEPWNVRCDPFSSYRAGFEVRTYRLCRRVLMFHHFKDELGVDDYLVRSTDFTYSESPIASFMTSVTQSGYVLHEGNTYLKKSLPSVEFEYSPAQIDDTVKEVAGENLENLPMGVDGSLYQWVDLDGEGISGVLTEQADSWFYKRRQCAVASKANNEPDPALPHFAPVELVAKKPNATLSAGGAQFLDLAGDGQLDLVEFRGPVSGFYERTADQGWERFKNFRSMPNIPWNDPNLKFVDLTGDGHADVLITEDDIFTWYPSLAEEGFDNAEKCFQPTDEEKGPRLVFADGTQSIYLADVSGDGLSDIVRIRNGEVCYWPNLGYGRFGAKVTMDNSPWFDMPDLFDQKRIRLADIDGSGTTDIIYLGSKGVGIYRNESGNGWSEPEYLQSFPAIDDLSSVVAVDLRGNGTACLVWSSSLPGDARRPMRYIDLMGGEKPHLLIKSVNNLGAETHVHYAASTKFYLEDKENGKPWVTRLPFPVHVVERVETYDWISRNYFVTRYAYHHGYFDGVEREFRGFGMVEQWDTEEFDVLKPGETFHEPSNIDAASHVPPAHTKTWFHTGAWVEEETISQHMAHEYFGVPPEDDSDFEKKWKDFQDTLLPDTVPPQDIRQSDDHRLAYSFNADEQREAVRALKGSILRQEVYADDGSDKQHVPYSISERDYTIECFQPQAGNRHAVFFVHPRETIDYHYERNPGDPRVSHTLTLAVDAFGNPLRSIAVGYPRCDLPDRRPEQNESHLTLTLNWFANYSEEPEWYRAGLLIETRTYEITKPPAASPRFSFDALRSLTELMVPPGEHEPPEEKTIPCEQWDWRKQWDPKAEPGGPANTGLRLIEHVRPLYRKNNLTGPLDFGTVESLALPYDTYKLAFTPSLLKEVFADPGKMTVEELDKALRDEGKYIQFNGSRNWWIPSGRVFFDPLANVSDPATTAAEELITACEHFFQTRKYADPFSESTIIDYDAPHDLLIVRTQDALANTVESANDYRVLQPMLVTDPNRNRTSVAFDALGMVVATAVMGKEDEPDRKAKGDLLEGLEGEELEADITQARINEFMDKPRDPGGNPSESVATQVVHKLLGKATTRIIYDLERFKRLGEPPFAATLARETHFHDLGGTETKIQISFSYSDGFGREIQKKIQAEPGPVPKRDANDKIIVGGDGQPVMTEADKSPRWVGSGWTVFNNKGKPVRQYEPFFTGTHLFDFDVKVGVSPTLFYDPLDRVVATLHPDHTYEKVVFDPWQQTTWDVNDTLGLKARFDPRTPDVLPDHTVSPADDPDVGDFFERLPAEDYLPTWFDVRMDPAKALAKWPDGDPLSDNARIRDSEKDAAEKAARHAATPTTAHLDTLGRTFLTVSDNGLDEDGNPQLYATRVELDIENNQRSVVDSLDRVLMRYDYDMLSNRIHQASMDAGERWTLNDVLGNPIRAWDSRGFLRTMTYDELRRPIGLYVTEDGVMRLAEETIYGEGQGDAGNHRTRVFQVRDGAGAVTSVLYDFKGNLLQSQRDLLPDYKEGVDWLQHPVANDGTFISRTTYDALNRPTQVIAPHSDEEGAKINVIEPIYSEANLLEQVHAWLSQNAEPAHWLDPDTADMHAVTDIDYNAKGQRELIAYGNGAQTTYEYDPLTFRLTKLKTTRPAGLNGLAAEIFADPTVVQDVRYTYDPAGNITRIEDAALRTVFHNGGHDAVCNYTYDATYRLIEATGREHIGQTAFQFHPTVGNYRDYPAVGAAHPNDLQAIRNYTERYEYDEVGNFQFMHHAFEGGGWTRRYEYKADSLIELGKYSNRLTKTSIGNGTSFTETYNYTDARGNDVHGCMTVINNMKMAWDFEDQLHQVDLGGGGTAYYVYDAGGQRVRKVIHSQNGMRQKERIYLGAYEIYREYNGNSKPSVECETLHVLDDQKRIALVETQTVKDGKRLDESVSLQRYQLSNLPGSVGVELGRVGALISYEEYHPYGTTAFQATDVEVSLKRYRYTGKERDEESGLYYHGARYYAPWLGRWASCDPTGMIESVNLFEYVANSPVNFHDPTGRDKRGSWEMATAAARGVYRFGRGVVKGQIETARGFVSEAGERIKRTVAEAKEHPLQTVPALALTPGPIGLGMVQLRAEARHLATTAKAAYQKGGKMELYRQFHPMAPTLGAADRFVKAVKQGNAEVAGFELHKTVFHSAVWAGLALAPLKLASGAVAPKGRVATAPGKPPGPTPPPRPGASGGPPTPRQSPHPATPGGARAGINVPPDWTRPPGPTLMGESPTLSSAYFRGMEALRDLHRAYDLGETVSEGGGLLKLKAEFGRLSPSDISDLRLHLTDVAETFESIEASHPDLATYSTSLYPVTKHTMRLLEQRLREPKSPK